MKIHRQILLPALILVGLTSCISTRHSGVVHHTEHYSGTKIMVITKLNEIALQSAFNDFLQRRFGIDPNFGQNPIASKVGQYENYYVQFFISFKDSIATVYGNAGDIGLNGLGKQPSAYNIIWSPIKMGGRGWELMTIIATLPDSRLEY